MRFHGFSKIAIVIAFSLGVISLPARADVLKIVVNDTIQPVEEEFIDHAIQEAKKSHSEALLIELNTPGGLGTSTNEIVQKVLGSPVPVIIFVTPSGSHAASAGFYILESADVAAMSPGTTTGSAHPVRGDGITMDPVLKEKWENDAAALIRSYVAKRGRNLEVAESAVRQSKSFSADEALAQHLIEYIAKDETDLLRQLDGKTIARFDGAKVTLHLAGKPVRELEMSLRERTLSWLLNPSLAALLFSIGLLALYAEFNHPGAVVPGVIGFIFVLLALFALHMLPVRYEALILLIGAFVMFGLEAKLHSHGALTAGGIAMMILGMLLLVNGPIPEMRVQLWAALAISIPLGLITVFLMSIAMRARRNKVTTGVPGLIGETGVVTVPLLPAGKVLLRGALWDAVAPVNVDIGQRIVVRGVHDLVLQVEPVSQPVAAGPAHA
ncbi:MAG TPA: nodulation protein NfeD [Candidatus Angelobacter sp.]|nr:nodulation protein NfeD [Candidatus Angelobacter sp.]